jgi:hypothetical protein
LYVVCVTSKGSRQFFPELVFILILMAKFVFKCRTWTPEHWGGPEIGILLY